MRVSAVIPCYNVAAYIGEAVDSAFRQTRPPDEVLVVDDCSTDGSADVARAHGARVVTTASNSGEGAARNTGALAATGELIAWLDADDYWTDDHLATLVPLLERFPEAVLAFSRVRLFGTREGVWPALLPEGEAVDAFAASLRRCVLPHNAVVVRRAELLAAGGYHDTLRMAADYELWLRLSREHPFVCSHAVTCHWRHHGENLSRNLLAYQKSEYETRWRLWQRVLQGEPLRPRQTPHSPEADRAALAAALLAIWEEHLWVAWYSRDPRQMRFHLSMRRLVPDTDAAYARWRRRARLLPVARAYDRLRSGVRMLRK